LEGRQEKAYRLKGWRSRVCRQRGKEMEEERKRERERGGGGGGRVK
jgi:hypothetical protein